MTQIVSSPFKLALKSDSEAIADSIDPSRPLRFCMITTFYPPYNFGGDGIFVHQLANELARRGHHVEVIHCIDAYRLMGRSEPAQGYSDHPNVTVHGLQSGFGLISPLATQQTGRPLFKSGRIRQVLGKGFDVIHFHNISLVGGPKILEYGNAVKLYTMHEYWLVCPTHVLFKFNRAVCERPNCFTCTLTYKRPPQWWRYSGMMRSALRHVDALIAPSRFSKRLHEQMGVAAPIVHIPNFVADFAPDLPPVTAQELNASPKKPYFLFVGRLEKIKGVQNLIPIFRRFERAQLWIAGDGDFRGELQRLAGNSDNILFLGHRSKDELRILYRNATALVVPSLSYEVFPLVILEAFMQGTPVIARNIGGMSEIIEESGGGMIYETDHQLAEAMDALLSDFSRRNRMGAKGYEALTRKWSASSYLASYFGLIQNIAAARRTPSTPGQLGKRDSSSTCS